MSLPIYEIANFNLIQFASIYNDFISSVPKELDLEWMDETGEIKQIKIKNVGAIQQTILSDVIEEKNARIDADKQLDEKFSKEISTININLQNEINNRIKAINDLTEQLQNEIKARTSDVEKINKILDDLKTNFETFEKSLTDALNEEIERAKSAEADLKKAIEDEANERKEADAEINTKINDINTNLSAQIQEEINERKEADAELEKSLTDYIDTKVFNEESRAKEAEGNLEFNKDIKNDDGAAPTNLTDAINDVDNKVVAEAKARKAADGSLKFDESIIKFDETEPTDLTEAINTVNKKIDALLAFLHLKIVENKSDITYQDNENNITEDESVDLKQIVDIIKNTYNS